MSRETKKITLPLSKIEVEVKSYITGGEKQELIKFILGESKIDAGSSAIKGDISLQTVLGANDKAFEMLVVSFNGSKENIVENIKDLRMADYDYLKNIMDAISNDRDFLVEGQS